MVQAIIGPKYDGKYLHEVVKEKLKDTRLSNTITNVVIPTFDIKKLQPTIFSTYEVHLRINSSLNNIIWFDANVSTCLHFI